MVEGCVNKATLRGGTLQEQLRTKCGKSSGIDGIAAEILKHGWESVVDWMHLDAWGGTRRLD